MKLNERAWAGQIISWIKQSINDGTTLFQDATNDEGLKLASGRTKFPDVLLFIDKISGIVFNGWELKFPDTEADNTEMLENALEKAERLQSDSFVTWNGTEAIIWKINDNNYSLTVLEKFALDEEHPGYRYIRLKANGEIETQVHRLSNSQRLSSSEVLGYD